jgi:hypothetical protein
MADTFEDLKGTEKGALVTFQVEDGKPISGIFVEADEVARTVTLLPKRVISFLASHLIERSEPHVHVNPGDPIAQVAESEFRK